MAGRAVSICTGRTVAIVGKMCNYKPHKVHKLTPRSVQSELEYNVPEIYLRGSVLSNEDSASSAIIKYSSR
jgi:hypothetical protein